MLEVKNLRKTYKSSKGYIEALSNVSICFEKSKIYGVIGPNGAGKTTLLKTICGLIYPDEGNVYIDNDTLYPSNFRLLKNIGAILEGSRNIFWNFTPLQNVRYFALLKGIELKHAISRALKYFELFNIIDKINMPVRNLSQGMKQKIAITISTLHNPSILLLDEPTLGLDLSSSLAMQRVIKDLVYIENKTVILTSHQMDIIEKNCDCLIFLKEGKVKSFDSIVEIKKRFAEKIYIFTVKEGNNLKTLEKKLTKEEFSKFLDLLQKDKNRTLIDIETREQSLEDIFLKASQGS